MLLSPHSFLASFPNSWDPNDQASLPSRNHTLARRRQFYLFKENLGVPSTIFFQCTFLASVEPEEDHTHTSTEQVGCLPFLKHSETSQLILLWIHISGLWGAETREASFPLVPWRCEGHIWAPVFLLSPNPRHCLCASSLTLFLEEERWPTRDPSQENLSSQQVAFSMQSHTEFWKTDQESWIFYYFK